MGLKALTSSLNPVDLADVKTHLRIVDDQTIPDTSVTFSSDDGALSVFIDAALEWVETETRQQLCTRQYLYTADGFPGQHGCAAREPLAFDRVATKYILLPKPPLQSVASIIYRDSEGNDQPLDPSAYIIDSMSMPGRIVLKNGRSWPVTDGEANCVRITFTAGYGDDDAVPTILRQCILLLVGAWYENREDAQNSRIITSIPLGVQSIINQNSYPQAVA